MKKLLMSSLLIILAVSVGSFGTAYLNKKTLDARAPGRCGYLLNSLIKDYKFVALPFLSGYTKQEQAEYADSVLEFCVDTFGSKTLE